MARSYVSGYDGRTVTTPLAFTRWCKEQLGCEVPVGSSARGKWFQRLKDEMDVQGWTFADLVEAVEWAKRKGIVIRRIDGIFYYVEKAKSDGDESIHAKVAQALEEEDDPWWCRRLSLAKGKMLHQVYQEWLAHRGGTDAVR